MKKNIISAMLAVSRNFYLIADFRINKNTVCAVLKKAPKGNPNFMTKSEYNAVSQLEIEMRFQQKYFYCV